MSGNAPYSLAGTTGTAAIATTGTAGSAASTIGIDPRRAASYHYKKHIKAIFETANLKGII